MLKLAPILIALIYGYTMYRFSAWRTKSNLNQNSTLLDDNKLRFLTDKMAKSLDLSEIKVNVYETDAVNGLAAPDGRIFITRGFLNKYKTNEVTAEELASVIAPNPGRNLFKIIIKATRIAFCPEKSIILFREWPRAT